MLSPVLPPFGMPTLNKYTDKSGYYIRARTPETGNITYKIYSKGNSVLRDAQLKAGDEISWDVIKTLKALELIYTDGSGTLGPDDFVPSTSGSGDLSPKQAELLLESIQANFQLTEKQLRIICDILGLDVPKQNIESTRTQLEAEVQSIASKIPMTTTLSDCAAADLATSVSINQTHRLGTELQITLLNSNLTSAATAPDEWKYVQHTFRCGGLISEGQWSISGIDETSWRQVGEAYAQFGLLLPIVERALEREEFEVPDTPAGVTISIGS